MSRKPTPLMLAALVATGVALVQALMIMWFAWPAQHADPRDLPVVVAGPAPAATALAAKLREARPGAFDIRTVPDGDAADAALRDRSAYAAFVVGASGVTVHVASAAGPTVSTLVSQAAQRLGGAEQIAVVDVVATPADDPRGAGFTSGFLPLLMTSIACGVALLFLVNSHAVRVAGVVAFAVLAGLISTGVLHALGLLTGPYLVEAGGIALLVLSISAAVSGLGAAIGTPGIGASVLVVFFIGNPISGLASAPELLPTPWGTIGQFLPPGAGATLLRSVAFFDGAGATRPLLVLVGWAVAGLALTAVGHYRERGAVAVSS